MSGLPPVQPSNRGFSLERSTSPTSVSDLVGEGLSESIDPSNANPISRQASVPIKELTPAEINEKQLAVLEKYKNDVQSPDVKTLESDMNHGAFVKSTEAGATKIKKEEEIASSSEEEVADSELVDSVLNLDQLNTDKSGHISVNYVNQNQPQLQKKTEGGQLEYNYENGASPEAQSYANQLPLAGDAAKNGDLSLAMELKNLAELGKGGFSQKASRAQALSYLEDLLQKYAPLPNPLEVGSDSPLPPATPAA
jgi:hypothetical protein